MNPSEPAATSEERLREVLSSVSDWLRYAEAKNGAIAAAALGLAVGSAQAMDWGASVPVWLKAYLILVLVQLLFAAAISLTSFLPRTDIGRLKPRGEKSEADNLLYFGHIAKYPPKYFLNAVRELEGREEVEETRLEKNFAQQAVVNARIALWKFTCSTWSLRLFLSALISPIGVWGIEMFLRRGKE